MLPRVYRLSLLRRKGPFTFSKGGSPASIVNVNLLLPLIRSCAMLRRLLVNRFKTLVNFALSGHGMLIQQEYLDLLP